MKRSFLSKPFVLMLVLLLFVGGILMTGCGGRDDSDGDFADYPTQSIGAICPWTAGGGSDVAFRGFIQYMAEDLGVDINVTNITGGNGAIGWAELAESPADGYTLGLVTFDVLTNQAMGTSPVTHEDFEIINQFTAQGTVLITHADYGYGGLEDFLEAARKAQTEGRTMQIGVAGEGGVWHQAGALMANETGTQDAFIYVPFQGSADQLADLLGKHLDAIVSTTTASLDHIRAGTLQLLATMSEQPLDDFPDVPTFLSAGYDVIYESWRIVVVPAGTPAPIVARLREAGVNAYNNPKFQEWATATDIGQMFRDHQESRTFIQNQYPVVENIMRELGLI